jgi:hypothetical protein
MPGFDEVRDTPGRAGVLFSQGGGRNGHLPLQNGQVSKYSTTYVQRVAALQEIISWVPGHWFRLRRCNSMHYWGGLKDYSSPRGLDVMWHRALKPVRNTVVAQLSAGLSPINP